MTTPTMGCGYSEEAFMELTMAEKRDFIEKITDLVKNDVLNREDRDSIYRVCFAACGRELAKMKEE